MKEAPKSKKTTSIERLLEWAFGAEKAQLEPRKAGPPIPSHLGYRSIQASLMQLAALGVRIDVSHVGAKFLADDIHWDAETVAAVVAGGLPRSHAELVAGYARSGTRPSWMEGAKPAVISDPRFNEAVPAGPSSFRGGVWRPWMGEARKSRKAAGHAPVEMVGQELSENFRKYLGYCCPISYQPSVQEIETARETYVVWWKALYEIRERLIESQVLKSYQLTAEMPPAMPWMR